MKNKTDQLNKTQKNPFQLLCLVMSLLLAFTCVPAGILASEADPSSIQLTEAVPKPKPSLDKTKAVMGIGEIIQINMLNTKKEAVWSSSDRKVARVSKKGKVLAVGEGKATITAAILRFELTCEITVVKRSLTMTQEQLTLKKGQIYALRVKKENLTGTVSWTSSNPSVVTVNKYGTIKAKSVGSAVICAEVGTYSAECKVTVKASSASTRWKRLLERYLPYSGTKQLVFVKYTGGSSAIVKLYTKSAGKWKRVLTCQGEVGQGGIGTAREGIAVTPTGVYNLTGAFGIAPNPGAKMKYIRVNQYLYWCGDRNFYNQLIDIREHPHNCQGEHLIEYTQCYEYGMFFDYNKENIYGKGSAFFLHVKGNYGYTGGCVAVSRANMIKILQTCEKGAKICIYPR